MTDRRETKLQEPQNWDFEKAERRPGSTESRAVVSVAFSRQDFERVAACAGHQNMRTSEFIREAALEKAARVSRRGTVVDFTGSLGMEVFITPPLPSTRMAGTVSEETDLEPTVRG